MTLEQLIANLMVWIAANTGYAIESVPAPAVVPMSAFELTREFYSDYPDQMPADGVDERIAALYNAESSPVGIIFVLSPAVPGELDDPLFAERLLHELVHHTQHHSGRWQQWPCRAIGEREAYTLGGRYLRQRGVEDPLPNRRFWAAIYSRC